MRLIDTHCHLYADDFKEDLNTVIQRAVESGVEKIFLPAIDSETHEQLIQLSESEQKNACIYPTIGLHPCSVKENFKDELNIVEQYLNSAKKFFAIGETGLDYYWDVSFKEQQIFSFEKQIDWSVRKNLPVIIHSRNSTSDCIKSVSKFNGNTTGIFHCFSGTLEEAQQVIEFGMYLGIGGVVTYKNTNLRDILRKVGLSNVVLETDAPYLPPIPHRGKRNEPSFIKVVCETIANTLQMRADEVAEITSVNAMQVFQIKN